MKHITVAAAVVRKVNEQDQEMILTTQRGYGQFKGGWEFPGGKIEEGETYQETLKRELMEELEADITVGQLIDIVEYDYPDFHLTMHCFFATMNSNHMVLKEHQAFKWLTKEEINSVDWLPADINLVKKISKILK